MRSLLCAALVAAILCPVTAAASPAADNAGNPASAAFLRKLKSEIESESLIRREYTHPEILAALVGKGFQFANRDFEDGTPYTTFADAGDTSLDDSAESSESPPLRPCIGDGGSTVVRNADAHRLVELTLQVSHRCWRTGLQNAFSALQVIEHFGTPQSTSDGIPLVPPEPGAPPAEEHATHPLGNLWLRYEFPLTRSIAKVAFRTLPGSEVIEIDIRVEER